MAAYGSECWQKRITTASRYCGARAVKDVNRRPGISIAAAEVRRPEGVDIVSSRPGCLEGRFCCYWRAAGLALGCIFLRFCRVVVA